MNLQSLNCTSLLRYADQQHLSRFACKCMQWGEVPVQCQILLLFDYVYF